jgi:hypothetical protein
MFPAGRSVSDTSRSAIAVCGDMLSCWTCRGVSLPVALCVPVALCISVALCVPVAISVAVPITVLCGRGLRRRGWVRGAPGSQ